MIERIAGAFCVMICLATSGGAQTTWYVDLNGTPPGSGSAMDPYTSIQVAISAGITLSGDTVVVLPGIYVELVNFVGKDVHLLAEMGPSMTTIDGNGLGRCVSFNTGEGPGAILEGFTIINGDPPGDSFAVGGAVYCFGTSPRILDNEIRHHVGSGAVALEGGNALVRGNLIEENGNPDCESSPEVSTSGIGIWARSGGAPRILENVIRNNRGVIDNGNSGGGGIAVTGGSAAEIVRNQITDNCAWQGGGIICVSETALIHDNEIRGNRATVGAGVWIGGASVLSCNLIVDNVAQAAAGGLVGGSSPLVTGNTFRGNVATNNSGGGLIVGSHLARIVGNLFEGNTTSHLGGGIYVTGSASFCQGPLLCRNRIQGNQAMKGGGIGVSRMGLRTWSNCVVGNLATEAGGGLYSEWGGICGALVLWNDTFHDNTAMVQGGGVHQNCLPMPPGPPQAVLRNAIVWGNSAPLDPDLFLCDLGGVAHSIVQGSSGVPGFGVGVLDLDPMLLELCHLGVGSPAIDAGDPATAPPVECALEIDAQDRLHGSAADMGCDEYTAGPPFLALCFGDGTGTPCPCANDGAIGHGCANGTFASGSRLDGLGTNSAQAADLTLRATASTPNQPGLFFLGEEAINGGLGVAFGDGLRCAGVGVIRLEVRVADGAGLARSTVDIAAAAGVCAGDTRYAQWWYRDPQQSPCGAGFNLSNMVEARWIP